MIDGRRAVPTRRQVAATLALGAAAPVLGGAARPSPRRIVSLNPCLDVLLLHLADRDQIAALSHYARDPTSSSAGPAAKGIPVTYDTAEEVVALKPDLVLMARYYAPATRAALGRLGVPTEQFTVPASLAESLAQVRQAARAVGRPERGEAVVRRIEAALAAAAPRPGEARLSAVVYQSGGFASAQGTLMDDLMRRAGLDNAAGRYGLRQSGYIPLEALVADPPQVILAGQPEPGAPTWADRLLHHPAFVKLGRRVRFTPFPQRLMFCGGPVIVETAAMLAKARRDAQAALTGGGA